MDERANPLSGRLILGLSLVALGALWTLDNLGFLDADPILRWWPLVPLAVGVMKLTGVGMEKQVPFGAFLAIVGGLFLLGEMNVVRVNFGIIWPLLFIFLGTRLVTRAVRGQEAPAGGADSGDYVRSFAVMAGIKRRSDSPTFRGGELTAVMGGVDLDLDQARPAGGRAVVDVFAFWGGIEIRVPEDWRVEVEATPIMGAVESNARLAPGVEPVGVLVVRGFVMMGGVEIKNLPLDGRDGAVFVRTRREGDHYTRKEVRIDDRGGISVKRESGRHDPSAPQPPVDPR